MGTALLGCVLCEPNTYHPHKSPGPRDSATQTADRELQSARPPIFVTSVNAPFGCRPSGLKINNEIGETCRACGARSGAYRVLVGRPEGKRPSGSPRAILKHVFMKREDMIGLLWLRIGTFGGIF